MSSTLSVSCRCGQFPLSLRSQHGLWHFAHFLGFAAPPLEVFFAATLWRFSSKLLRTPGWLEDVSSSTSGGNCWKGILILKSRSVMSFCAMLQGSHFPLSFLPALLSPWGEEAQEEAPRDACHPLLCSLQYYPPTAHIAHNVHCVMSFGVLLQRSRLPSFLTAPFPSFHFFHSSSPRVVLRRRVSPTHSS